MAILNRHIKEAEETARTRYDQHKWMGFAFWKTIAGHVRKMKREIESVLTDDRGPKTGA